MHYHYFAAGLRSHWSDIDLNVVDAQDEHVADASYLSGFYVLDCAGACIGIPFEGYCLMDVYAASVGSEEVDGEWHVHPHYAPCL